MTVSEVLQPDQDHEGKDEPATAAAPTAEADPAEEAAPSDTAPRASRLPAVGEISAWTTLIAQAIRRGQTLDVGAAPSDKPAAGIAALETEGQDSEAFPLASTGSNRVPLSSSAPRVPGEAVLAAIQRVASDDASSRAHAACVLDSVIVVGQLNLSGHSVPFPITLRRCRLEEPLQAHATQLHSVLVEDCDYVGFDFSDASISHDVELRSGLGTGTVRLDRARVGGRLALVAAQIVTDAGPALSAERAVVHAATIFSGPLSTQDTVVSLVRARLLGGLSARAARWSSSRGASLDLSYAVVGDDVRLPHDAIAGTVVARYARVHGEWDMTRAAVSAVGPQGITALDFTHAHIDAVRLDTTSVKHGELRWEAARLGVVRCEHGGAMPTLWSCPLHLAGAEVGRWVGEPLMKARTWLSWVADPAQARAPMQVWETLERQLEEHREPKQAQALRRGVQLRQARRGSVWEQVQAQVPDGLRTPHGIIAACLAVWFLAFLSTSLVAAAGTDRFTPSSVVLVASADDFALRHECTAPLDASDPVSCLGDPSHAFNPFTYAWQSVTPGARLEPALWQPWPSAWGGRLTIVLGVLGALGQTMVWVAVITMAAAMVRALGWRSISDTVTPTAPEVEEESAGGVASLLEELGQAESEPRSEATSASQDSSSCSDRRIASEADSAVGDQVSGDAAARERSRPARAVIPIHVPSPAIPARYRETASDDAMPAQARAWRRPATVPQRRRHGTRSVSGQQYRGRHAGDFTEAVVHAVPIAVSPMTSVPIDTTADAPPPSQEPPHRGAPWIMTY